MDLNLYYMKMFCFFHFFVSDFFVGRAEEACVKTSEIYFVFCLFFLVLFSDKVSQCSPN